MRYDLIVGALQTAGVGVVGTNLFVHRMDADCKLGIMVRGPIDGVPVDVDLPNYYKHSMQLIVRAADQLTGDALMASAIAALTTQQPRVFNDSNGNLLMQLNHLVPRTLPRVYPRLDGQGIEISVDFNTNYVMPPNNV